MKPLKLFKLLRFPLCSEINVEFEGENKPFSIEYRVSSTNNKRLVIIVKNESEQDDQLD